MGHAYLWALALCRNACGFISQVLDVWIAADAPKDDIICMPDHDSSTADAAKDDIICMPDRVSTTIWESA